MQNYIFTMGNPFTPKMYNRVRPCGETEPVVKLTTR